LTLEGKVKDLITGFIKKAILHKFMKIILASQSIFRKHALDILGLNYETIPSKFDEKSVRDHNPQALAKKLSEAKAKEIGRNKSNAIVIAGDLFVVFKQKIYGKPQNKPEALRMLKSFSGNWLHIIAGVAVYNSKTKQMLSSVQKYAVKFRNLMDYEIKNYIARYPVLTFSAAFDGDGLLRFAEHVEGNYPFLTGFPMQALIILLRKNGLRV
jgi:septum formation protein